MNEKAELTRKYESPCWDVLYLVCLYTVNVPMSIIVILTFLVSFVQCTFSLIVTIITFFIKI